MPNPLILAFAMASGLGTEQSLPGPVHLFFLGCTEGKGVLKVVMRHPRGIRVHSSGRQGSDGTLIVNQKVEEEGRPPISREWRLQESQPYRFTGTLSTASGPVAGRTMRDGLHLQFRMKGGLHVQQRLSYASDGENLNNVMTVRKLGLVVGRLQEKITKTADESCD